MRVTDRWSSFVFWSVSRSACAMVSRSAHDHRSLVGLQWQWGQTLLVLNCSFISSCCLTRLTNFIPSFCRSKISKFWLEWNCQSLISLPCCYEGKVFGGVLWVQLSLLFVRLFFSFLFELLLPLLSISIFFPFRKRTFLTPITRQLLAFLSFDRPNLGTSPIFHFAGTIGKQRSIDEIIAPFGKSGEESPAVKIRFLRRQIEICHFQRQTKFESMFSPAFFHPFL